MTNPQEFRASSPAATPAPSGAGDSPRRYLLPRPRLVVADCTRSLTPLDIATGEIRAARTRQRVVDALVLACLFSPVWLPAIIVGVSQ